MLKENSLIQCMYVPISTTVAIQKKICLKRLNYKFHYRFRKSAFVWTGSEPRIESQWCGRRRVVSSWRPVPLCGGSSECTFRVGKCTQVAVTAICAY